MRTGGSIAWLIAGAFAGRLAASETQHSREYFYVGGKYVTTSSGTLFQEQMYVEKLTPAKITQKYPLVLMHGGGQTGTNFLNKPDGGKGWASWFMDKGYVVYIVDEPARGRSPWNPLSNTSLAVFSAEVISARFTAVQLSTAWPQAKLHTQWPGSGQRGDPVFDAYYASVVQGIANGTDHERMMQEAGAALLDKIGPVVMITHSQGGLYGWGLADVRPSKIKALVQIEPKGPPFYEVLFSTDFTRPYGLTSIPLTYNPPTTNLTRPLSIQRVNSTSTNQTDCWIQTEPARKLTNIAKVPILVDTGEASYHAMYDYCFIKFLKQAGVSADFLELGKAGIHGNAHLQFMEKNSDAIAAKLYEWIKKTAKS